MGNTGYLSLHQWQELKLILGKQLISKLSQVETMNFQCPLIDKMLVKEINLPKMNVHGLVKK